MAWCQTLDTSQLTVGENIQYSLVLFVFEFTMLCCISKVFTVFCISRVLNSSFVFSVLCHISRVLISSFVFTVFYCIYRVLNISFVLCCVVFPEYSLSAGTTFSFC